MPPKQSNREKALIALLETTSVRQAAEKCGLSERTLFKFLEDADFKTEYRNARRQTVESAIAKIQNAASEAVERLRDLMHCENPVVEARCAQIIYENSVKGMEMLDLAERLEEVENEFAKQTIAFTKQNRRRV
jgi:hypothetical protein